LNHNADQIAILESPKKFMLTESTFLQIEENLNSPSDVFLPNVCDEREVYD
jgi:hypothetical protein